MPTDGVVNPTDAAMAISKKAKLAGQYNRLLHHEPDSELVIDILCSWLCKASYYQYMFDLHNRQ